MVKKKSEPEIKIKYNLPTSSVGPKVSPYAPNIRKNAKPIKSVKPDKVKPPKPPKTKGLTKGLTKGMAKGLGAASSGGGSQSAAPPPPAVGFIIDEDFSDFATDGVTAVEVIAGAINGLSHTFSSGYWRCQFNSTITSTEAHPQITYDIPAELQGSTSLLDLSFRAGEFSTEWASTYWWYGVDSEDAETLIVSGNWREDYGVYKTCTDLAQTLPSDAVKLRLVLQALSTGAGAQTFDVRCDDISAELV